MVFLDRWYELLVTSMMVMVSGGTIAIESGYAPYSSGILTHTPCWP